MVKLQDPPRGRGTNNPQNLIGNELFRKRYGKDWGELQEKSSKQLEWWNPPADSFPVEFCQDTSLHGLKYIGQPNRHITERVFWIVTFLAGLSVAVWLIAEMWYRFKMNPVIVSFQPFETNVDQIPFPAVTVCNMNKVMRSKAIEFIRKASNGDAQAKRDVYYLDHVCSSTKSFSTRFNFTQNPSGDFLPNLEWQRDRFMFNDTAYTENLTRVNEFLRRAAQNCTEMIPLCVWEDQEIPCTKIFRPIETEYGKCCVFNMIPLSLLYTRRNDSRENPEEIRQWEKWNIDTDGLLISTAPDQLEFPRRQMKAGLTNGLSFLLNVNYKEYYCTSSDSVGFRMATHLPVELAKIADFGISLRPQSEIYVDVFPQITMVDQDIYSFSLEKRNCYKYGEYNLRHFKYYSVNNCIDECIANDTRAICGCKRYYMPRNVSEPLCGPKNFECAEDVKYNKTKFGIRNTCPMCYQSCTEVEYDPQTTSTPIKKGIWRFANGSNSQWDDNDLSIVHVYIGQESFNAKVRKELFGTTDLFANTGGLMGLFLGFSGISLIELIYFLTLRAYFKFRRRQVVVNEMEEGRPKPIWMEKSEEFQRNVRRPFYYQSVFGELHNK